MLEAKIPLYMLSSPRIRYVFTIDGEKFCLATGHSKTSKSGQVIKVVKYQKAFSQGNGFRLDCLWITTDGGHWWALEKGKRVKDGSFRDEFTRIDVSSKQQEIVDGTGNSYWELIDNKPFDRVAMIPVENPVT